MDETGLTCVQGSAAERGRGIGLSRGEQR
jgi:hypothetical protein